MKKEGNICFLPVYINKTKLLDINSILFDGYSEFSEVNFQNDQKNGNTKNAGVSASFGMSIFTLGGQLGSSSSTDSGSSSNISLKKVQTSSSLLANTINLLSERKAISMVPSKVGQFVEVEGIFKNNSMIDFIDQILDMTNLARLADKLGEKLNDENVKGNKRSNGTKNNKDSSHTKNDYRSINDQVNSLKQLLSSKSSSTKSELVCEKKDIIYVIHLDQNCLYNCGLSDIYNKELTFFGQVKGIYDKYKFFSDTPLSKFREEWVEEVIENFKPVINNGIYDIDFELMTNSNCKKVIELDIVAVYRNIGE